jgi:ABC-2 type transport system permease protein
MLSLEGRKFWILGLLPFERSRLLWGKFAFSATWSLLISEFLVVFSDSMLGMPVQLIGVHVITVAVLALGLSGLSVGLGAWMPNFRESDPSKIAVGFGGTLNLVTCLFFLLLVVVVMAGPWHLQMLLVEKVYEDVLSLSRAWLIASIPIGILLGAVAVVFPLRLGARALRQMEF